LFSFGWFIFFGKLIWLLTVLLLEQGAALF